jgi:3-oxoacyl-[acyl-carrier-protein] synthase-3
MTPCAAAITAIAYHLPAKRVDNADLAAENPDWHPDKLEAKTGIVARRISAPNETAADLAIAAARRVLAIANRSPAEIDYVIFCSQSPDYLLPSTACLIQQELGIPSNVGALDMNLGCSGFVYGLGLCKGLIESGQANRILLLTADTYSKYIHPADRSVRVIFGDAGAATIVEGVEAPDGTEIGPFRYGTSGKGAGDLVVPDSGARARAKPNDARPLLKGGPFGPQWLYMNGPAVFQFTLGVVPKLVTEVLSAAALSMEDVAMIIPHQANAYMLESLRKRLDVPADKLFVNVREIGNTVSATIPIALVMAASAGRIEAGQRLLLLGFGIGLSWGGAMIRWRDAAVGFSDARDAV